jgi:hypothetical protein
MAEFGRRGETQNFLELYSVSVQVLTIWKILFNRLMEDHMVGGPSDEGSKSFLKQKIWRNLVDAGRLKISWSYTLCQFKS